MNEDVSTFRQPFIRKVIITSAIITIAILIWFLSSLFVFGYININHTLSLKYAAEIGGFVGGFIGIFVAIIGVLLLYETLYLQRHEFIQNRKVFKQQQFEITFFNFINAHHEITNQIEYMEISDDKVEEFNSRRLFVHIEKEMRELYKLLLREKIDRIGYSEIQLLDKFFADYFRINKIEEKEAQSKHIFKELNNIITLRKTGDQLLFLKKIYKMIFDYYHKYCGHYFRHLYHILKFIYEREQNETDRDKHMKNDYFRKYSDIVQSSLSSSELFVLFYNGLCFKEMKKLLHHFDFLENLSFEDLLESTHTAYYLDCVIDNKEYPAIKFKSRDDLIIKEAFFSRG